MKNDIDKVITLSFKLDFDRSSLLSPVQNISDVNIYVDIVNSISFQLDFK